MVKLISFFFLFVFSFSVRTQVNLVPNFSFEQYSSCPGMEDQVDFCDGWTKYSTNSTTPDYYNACSPFFFSVPQSQAFYQPSHRNCDAYMGLATWVYNLPEYREQIGIQLNQTLIIGQKYYLSFYAVMALNDNYMTPSNNIGMRLSSVPYSSSNPAPIDNISHLHSQTIISDTANWMRISGAIVADSNYNYLILGNFYDDSNTDTLTQSCGSCQNWYSYYLVDDICVSTDSSYCNGGIDIIPCTMSIEESNMNNDFSVYPNPTTDFVNIQSNFNAQYTLSVYNSLGQQLYTEQNITVDNFQLDLSNFKYNLLLFKITTQNHQLVYKLIKQ